MEKSYFSATWYRVADFRPRLRTHARIYRHHFRGQLWYVLQDRRSGRFHRFSPETYLVISLMNGERTFQEIWDKACERLEHDILTQDEMIQLLGHLHSADVLYGDVPPDVEELADRGQRQRTRKLMMSVMNPLALRLPLFDPDKFLNATRLLAHCLFSVFGALVFIGVVAYGGTLAGLHWSELTQNIVDRVIATENLLLLAIAYPVVKAFHELGHAYAVKRWGGDVHEIGVMFLVFMPVPYVDASESAAFREKWRRALVGAAGILVEVFLAAIAIIVWVNSEHGLVKAVAFTVMLIGGVSTVFFNGNPLLRFDGYYVLCDILEIPNLGSRANSYIGYLIQRYAFGATNVQSPVTAPGEPFWFISYALASFTYRLFIAMAIALFVGKQFFGIGVLIAIWALILMLGVPMMKQLRHLFTSPILRRVRGRALAVTGGAVAATFVVLFIVPVPHSTLAEGVTWAPGESVVYATADGVVTRLVAAPDEFVGKGTLLIQLEDPTLRWRARILEARVAELEHRRFMQAMESQAESKIALEELAQAKADLKLARQREHDLRIKSSTSGHFLISRAADLVGQFVEKGQILGYVVRKENLLIRAVVPEDSADLVRQRTQSIDVRFVSDPWQTYPAHVSREVPSLTRALPSRALSAEGGGQLNLDPRNSNQETALVNLLHLDLRLNSAQINEPLTERVYVRFFHGLEPLIVRLHRQVRQVFLKHFKV